VSAALRAELFKQRSTQTSLGVFVAMLALVLFVVLLHGLALPARNLGSVSEQLTVVFGWGEVFGALFAALLGALSITGEFRHGTIRPTFLVNASRRSVVAAKVLSSLLIGTGFGLVGGAVAAGVGTATLRARAIDVLVAPADYALLILGAAVAAALWAAIGVGLGAAVRNQVPTLVGIAVWLLFIENLLVGDLLGVGDLGQFLPGAAGRAISGQGPDTLLAPAAAVVLLGVYAAVAAVAGSIATSRRDIA
jgi:ABC-2 type transport system permease protein